VEEAAGEPAVAGVAAVAEEVVAEEEAGVEVVEAEAGVEEVAAAEAP
jgi:hypothetical protein